MNEISGLCATLCHFASVALLAGVLSACGGASSDPGNGAEATDPLVGTWTYSGRVPAFVAITLTMRADNSFTFVEEVAPYSLPAGYVPNGCVTTETYLGTYAATLAGAKSSVSWTFATGTANSVSGCNDPSGDSAGTAMTEEAIASYREQGLIPPSTVTYSVTSTALVLNPGVSSNKAVGLSASTTFAKSDY